jgi:hypothetical protein
MTAVATEERSAQPNNCRPTAVVRLGGWGVCGWMHASAQPPWGVWGVVRADAQAAICRHHPRLNRAFSAAIRTIVGITADASAAFPKAIP